MTPDTTEITPRLHMPLIEGGQALKHITHNEALLDLDTLLFLSLATLSASSPPAGEDRISVVVAEGATGAFSGHDGKIACRVDGAWRFYTPLTGQTAWVEEDASYRVYDEQDWQVASGSAPMGELDQLGIGTTADSVNRLVVKSPAALFTHDDQGSAPTGDIRINLNRATPTDTATCSFQTDYQGAAELGLSGDADFRIKTSADGADFATALRVATASGRVGIGERAPRYALDVNARNETGIVRMSTANTAPDAASGAAFTAAAGSGNRTSVIQYAGGAAYVLSTATVMTYQVTAVGGWHRFYSQSTEMLRIRPSDVECRVPLKLHSVTVSGLPSPVAGRIVFVTDDAQGPGPAYADGNIWRRMGDRSEVT